MGTTSTTGPIDLTDVYTLISGVPVLLRDDDTVQIGAEPPHWLLLHHAPANSIGILNRLNGTVPAGEVLDRHHADPLLWQVLLTRLRDADLLVPAADWSFPDLEPGPFLQSERDSLVHRYGIAAARRALQSRRDAVVVVRGSGRIATAIAVALGLAGVGHVHQQPDRALRPADLSDATGAPATRSVRPDRVPLMSAPTRSDSVRLAANLRRCVPELRTHLPAAHHRVSLTVLAGDGPPAPSLAAELSGQHLPHLAVRAGLTGTVVGPLVLPGRSSCLICALRRRQVTDPGRARIEDGLRQELVVPPAQLVSAAATLAVTAALDHLDGHSVPLAVDGTLEWQLGDIAPRRRTWQPHPDCGCQGAPTADSAAADRRER